MEYVRHHSPKEDPSPFDLGILAGRLDGITLSVSEIKSAVETKVSHAEFQRAFRSLIGILSLVLAGIIALAFKN